MNTVRVDRWPHEAKATSLTKTEKNTTRFAAADTKRQDLKLQTWNEYHLIAPGPHLILKINGQPTAELQDRENGKTAASGVLALPIIPGEPMKVQDKDLRLKVLPSLPWPHLLLTVRLLLTRLAHSLP